MTNKKNKKRKVSFLRRIIFMQGLTMKQVGDALEVSQPTLRRLIDEPQTMNGVRRAALADALALPITTIDAACRGEIHVTLERGIAPA